MRKLILAGFFIALAQTAQAETCDQKLADQGNQPAMNQCAKAGFEKADKELNTQYQKLLKCLPAERKELLKAAQRDWVKYRDSEAQFDASSWEGGTAEPMARSSSMEETTSQRVKELNDQIKECQ